MTKSWPATARRFHLCDQIRFGWSFWPHSAPGVGWITARMSTKPSSSPEFGKPSGPSLSYAPQSSPSTWASSSSRNVPSRDDEDSPLTPLVTRARVCVERAHSITSPTSCTWPPDISR